MLSLRSSNYILANMNCKFDISMESQLTNLFIDIFVFKMTKLSAVKICHEVKNPYLHYNLFKLKISAIIKDPHMTLLWSILDSSSEGRVSQILYLVLVFIL